MPEAENNGHPILEVIVPSLPDPIEGERVQADRLEVVRDLGRGGLKPDFSLVRAIRRTVFLPLRVMPREDQDHSLPSGDDQRRVTALELQPTRLPQNVNGSVSAVQVERLCRLLLEDCRSTSDLPGKEDCVHE